MNPDVLLADSNKLLLAAYESYLVAERFHVLTVDTGIECLKLLRTHPPRLLVLDPELLWGGMGILALLSEGVEFQAIPVIVLCEKPTQEMLKLMPVHSSALILKPFSPDSLASLVQKLMLEPTRQFYLEFIPD